MINLEKYKNDAFYFSAGFARVEADSGHGFINEKFEEIVPCIYDHIGDFWEGLVCVQKNKKHGAVDLTTGKEIIPCVFDSPVILSEAKAWIENVSAFAVSF